MLIHMEHGRGLVDKEIPNDRSGIGISPSATLSLRFDLIHSEGFLQLIVSHFS